MGSTPALFLAFGDRPANEIDKKKRDALLREGLQLSGHRRDFRLPPDEPISTMLFVEFGQMLQVCDL
jgi:hypothetical protein